MSISELSKLKIEKINDSLYRLETPIQFITPFMRVVFPVENNYGSLFLKLEFSNVAEDKKMKKFYSLIHTIEETFYLKLCHIINQKCALKSQISKYKEYDPFLLLKIPKKKKYVDATIVNSKQRTFYDIERNEYVRALIFADILWTDKKSFVLKWKIKQLEFQDPDDDDTNTNTGKDTQKRDSESDNHKQTTQRYSNKYSNKYSY
jgi:hypothetical protein